MRHAPARAAAAIAAGALLFVAAGPAQAHEQRTVAGLRLTVGWQHEPTYVGDLNAVQLILHDASGKAVDDLGDPPSLTLTVSTGAETSQPLTLTPSFDPDTGLGTHGEFDAPIIPTAPGVYRFHFTGTVAGQHVDQTFTSSDSTFDDVVEPTAVEFPVHQPPVAELGTGVQRAQSRASAAASRAGSARDDANRATVVGVVALVLAGVAVVMSTRRRHA
jgi:hypothetical protein